MTEIVLPFTISTGCLSMLETYPGAEQMKGTFLQASDSEREGILRLWMTEGIPFAFRSNPLAYEKIREFIGNGVNVHPKDVTLVGSARIGYSLKNKVWGKTFSERSDLDFTIISNTLFTKLVADFQQWVGDIKERRLRPHTPNQLKRWLDSIVTVDNNIPKGYIYTKNLFSNQKYRAVSNIYQTLGILQQRLAITPNSQKVSDLSVRVYADWKSCITQLQINFKSALGIKL